MALRRFSRGTIACVVAATLAIGGVALAQMEGERGAAPLDSSGSFEVNGIAVDVGGKTAEEARLSGWRLAQRRGWQLLAERLTGTASGLPDGTLDSIVSGIVVENEEIGPNRYVARLGILFDRGRAAAILGVGGQAARSPPMLVIPVQVSSGVAAVFETRTPWQQAWARYRTGNSAVDYVRPSGTGPDALLYNAGQLGRPSRGWWRTLLDQYGASDVLIPQVELFRQWPGGPVIGVFTARHGPDNRALRRFVLRVGSSRSLDALLDAGVRRLDTTYEEALQRGLLRPDIGLIGPPEQLAEEAPADEALDGDATLMPAPGGAAVLVQFDSPDGGAVNGAEAALRGVPGVRAAQTTSLALGGVSVMRVIYDGNPAALRASLQARGWAVDQAGDTLRIRRAPTLAPSALPGDDRVTG